MLFNSLEFILWFLPTTLLIWFQLGKWGYRRLAIGWLLAASLFFYSWWNPANLAILLVSIGVNYLIGLVLIRTSIASLGKKGLLLLGIVINLALIGYFKYANFFIANVNQVMGTSFNLGEIILPLGISFFTFQQIAYLVDAYVGSTEHDYRFTDYALFVTFFPQLIAGPIVHHRDIVSQFSNKEIYRPKAINLAVGITIFAIGLFKKVVFADSFAVYANSIFEEATEGTALTFLEAWIGALAYSLQLYFDFSGYSDMAIGIGRMFGIVLPINFNSPYKATSVIDFWNRWHITLSRFLRDYLYIPLGGNRKGEIRRGINLMLTMLIGGLWHGAGWTFVLWGGLHGIYLTINHQWRSFRRQVLHHDLTQQSRRGKLIGGSITFLAIVVGWVFFRATDISTAFVVLKGMVGMNGISLAEEWDHLKFLQHIGVRFEGLMPNVEIAFEGLDDEEVDAITAIQHTIAALLFVWFIPNTQQWFESFKVGLSDQQSPSQQLPSQQSSRPRMRITQVKNYFWSNYFWKTVQWQPNHFWAVIGAGLTAIALLHLTRVSQFLYFEF